MRLMLSLSFLLAVALATPAAASSPLEFAAPAQAWGRLSYENLEWVVILTPPEGSFDAELESFAEGHQVRHGAVKVGYQDSSGGRPAGLHNQTTSSEPEQLGPFQARLSSSQSWSALIVRGKDISLALSARGTLDTSEAAGTFYAHHPHAAVPRGTYRAQLEVSTSPNTFATMESSDGTTLEWSLNASHLASAEWQNGTVFCAFPGSCPDSAASRQIDEGLPALGLQAWHIEYGEFHASNATLAGQGSAAFVFAGGGAISVQIDGNARLPRVKTAVCNQCDSNGTLALAGNLTLQEIQPAGKGFRAALSGEVSAARIDEHVLDAAIFDSTYTVAAAAGIAGVALAVKFLLLPLFTRRSDEDTLSNELRRRLYDFIARNPGVHFREALRGANVPSGSGRHHVSQLVRIGLVSERRVGSKLRLFTAEAEGARWQETAALLNPNLRVLYEWVSLHPDQTQMEILEAFRQSHAWNPSTTQGRLARLVRDGAVTCRERGRYKHYKAIQPGGLAEVARTESFVPA